MRAATHVEGRPFREGEIAGSNSLSLHPGEPPDQEHNTQQNTPSRGDPGPGHLFFGVLSRFLLRTSP